MHRCCGNPDFPFDCLARAFRALLASAPMSTPEPQRTAEQDRDTADWDAIAADADFKKLLADKARFILPASIFFIVYYFALPVLVGWWPDLMKTKIGSVNVAYLFALSQFFMAWIVAGFYVVKAAGWDKSAAALLAKFSKR